METMWATVTSKGQITIPAAARRAVGIETGQKVAIRVEDRTLTIDAPMPIEELRALAREASIKAGTSHIIPVQGDGWTAHVLEKYGHG